jgi:hypothetical protein
MRGRPKSRLGHGLAAQPSGANGLRSPLQRVRASVVTTRRPRVGQRGGVLTGGSVVAHRWQGIADEHRWGPGVASGKEERTGAHRNGGSTARRRKRHRAAVFNGGGVAPVVIDEGGWVLQLEGDPGVRWRRSIEGKSSSEGRSPEVADGGDAQTESGTEEGLWWWKTSEEDAWAMGEACAVLERDNRRAVEKTFG